MKERGISFNTEMVRAILAGSKTQTRRIIEVQPTSPHHKPLMHKDTGWCWWFDGGEAKSKPFRFKHVNVGDRLWVRERFGIDEGGDVVYRADVGLNPKISDSNGNFSNFELEPADAHNIDVSNGYAKWRPPSHMRRFESRIMLEITGVRVERLQDISQSDAIAEGGPRSHQSIDQVSRELGYADFSRSWFAQLWEEIYGAGSWAKNEWVWVIEFKRIEV